MNYFYAPLVPNGVAYLNEEESGHCIRVMRHKEGDIIGLLDGNGGKYEAVIEQADHKKLHFRIISEKFNKKPLYSLHLGIAPTKNSDRIEWFAEKATEVGIDSISLFYSKNSERKKFRSERLQKKILNALKQSKNAFLPSLNDPVDFKKIIKKSEGDQKFIAVVDEKNTVLLEKIAKPGLNTMILIGPEGDFTAEEVIAAEVEGFQKVSLGDKILRTETAGLIACHTIHLINRLD